MADNPQKPPLWWEKPPPWAPKPPYDPISDLYRTGIQVMFVVVIVITLFIIQASYHSGRTGSKATSTATSTSR